jgi:hypothetical protein
MMSNVMVETKCSGRSVLRGVCASEPLGIHLLSFGETVCPSYDQPVPQREKMINQQSAVVA